VKYGSGCTVGDASGDLRSGFENTPVTSNFTYLYPVVRLFPFAKGKTVSFGRRAMYLSLETRWSHQSVETLVSLNECM